MKGLLIVIVIIVGVCWSEGKKAWAAKEADRINANRANPYRPSNK